MAGGGGFQQTRWANNGGVGAPPGGLPATYGPDGKIVYAGGSGGLPPTPGQQASQAGYAWDPVKNTYVRTPSSAGTNVHDYTNAALGGSMTGLLSAAGPGTSVGINPGGGSGGGGGGLGIMSSSPNEGIPGGGGAAISAISPVDMTASNAATFGAAKDQAGQTGRAEIDSMKGLMGASGMLGGGGEAQGTRDIVAQAGQGANDVTRANAVNSSTQNLDVAKTNQASALTQRGQDIAARQAQAQLAMEQAQLNSQRQLDMLRLALGSVSSGGGGGATSSPYTY